MKSDNFYSTATQVEWACQALLAGRSISHEDQAREARGWRLGAIVHNLKANYEWPILAEYRGPENVAFYRLDPDCDRSRLRFPRSARALAEEGGAA